MQRDTMILMLLLTATVHHAVSQVPVCSLPFRLLYTAEAHTLVACITTESSSLAASCQTACSCRRLIIGQSTYGLCLNNSVTFDCDAAENATRCTPDNEAKLSTAIIVNEQASNEKNSENGLKAWQWALIASVIALLVVLLLFVLNFVKNRPQRGDNRREVTASLAVQRSQSQDDVHSLRLVLCSSNLQSATSNPPSAKRSRETNPSQMSDFSVESYRTHAGNLMSSTLTDTEIVTQHHERAISSLSASSLSTRSSNCSQNVETSTMPTTGLLGTSDADGKSICESDPSPYLSHSSYSFSSDMALFSSKLTVNDSDIETGEKASCPRKKSIEL